MLQKDYPAQEPLSEVGERYSQECWRRSAGIEAEEHAYGSDPYRRLLVFRAKQPDGRVLVAWHGGGWTSGYKEWMGFMAPALGKAGVTLISPGYRLAPQNLFPAALDDCIAALRWAYRNVTFPGGKTPRFYLGGHSAGGHYAALLSVRRDWQAGAGVPADFVTGCLPISGVYDFTEHSGLTMRPRFLGPTGNEKPASPLHNLQLPLPPFLIAYGSEDFPHLIKQGERFAAAVAAADGKAERLVMAGRNHFSAHYAAGEETGPWVPDALTFMK
jgi:arylformamidase